MKKYILDTNIASLLGSEETQENQKIYEKFYQLDDEDVVMVSRKSKGIISKYFRMYVIF